MNMARDILSAAFSAPGGLTSRRSVATARFSHPEAAPVQKARERIQHHTASGGAGRVPKRPTPPQLQLP